MKTASKLVLLAFFLSLVIGVSHGLVTDGSFENVYTDITERCFIDNGIINFGDCKTSGADQQFTRPTYWYWNTSAGDYTRIIDSAMANMMGTSAGGIASQVPTYGCSARNVGSYTTPLNDTVQCYYTNYVELALTDSLPYPYVTPITTDGEYSLMIHNIPPSDCGINTGSGCGQNNDSYFDFVTQNVTLPTDDYVLSYDVRNCDFSPLQCDSNWCQSATYGDPKVPSQGYSRVILMNATNHSQVFVDYSENLGYRSGWTHNEIHLSEIDNAGNMTLGFGIYATDPYYPNAICVLYDNVSIEAVEPTVVPASIGGNHINFTRGVLPF